MSRAAPTLPRPELHETSFQDPNTNRRLRIAIDPRVVLPVGGDRIAIDEEYVNRPEDMQQALIDPDTGRPTIARSIIDLSELDPEYAVMHRLISSLEAGDNPDRVFPDGRCFHHYGSGNPVRSITTPFSRTETGKLLSPGPQITFTDAKRMVPASKALHSNDSYIVTQDTVHGVMGKEPKGKSHNKNPTERRQNASNTVGYLNEITNAILHHWSAGQGIPQITSTDRKPVETPGGTLMIADYVATTESDVIYGLDTLRRTYSGPGRKRAALFNVLQVVSTLESGEPEFGIDEATLYASWLTRAKHDRRIRQAAA